MVAGEGRAAAVMEGEAVPDAVGSGRRGGEEKTRCGEPVGGARAEGEVEGNRPGSSVDSSSERPRMRGLTGWLCDIAWPSPDTTSLCTARLSDCEDLGEGGWPARWMVLPFMVAVLARGRSAVEEGRTTALPFGRVSTCSADAAELRIRADWEEEVGELRGGTEEAVE